MSQNDALNEQDARSLLEGMLLIRRAEERLGKVKAEVGLPGSVHLSIGQEAIAVGVCSQLDERDWIGSTHRGHGHFLAKGGELKRLFAEVWAKRTGICQGMGGSMHVADFSKGIMGANGIVGGGLAIATGAGLSAQLDGKGAVSVCFFGDGAANQGVFMESMNMATIWKLPVIFVCENNGIAEFTVSSRVTGGALSDRARAFKMPVAEIDGNNILAVREAAAKAVQRARSGGGPSYIEATTYRIPGHLEGEEMLLGGGKYREPEEITSWQSPDKDPITRFTNEMISRGLLDREATDALDQSVLARIDDAVKFAEESEDADPELVYSLFPSARKELDFVQ